ncbi:MAG: hypothetical protein ACFFD2_22170 [Promethearchaeota archaeon]
MAGDDMKCDARGLIENFIKKKIRTLLEDPMNEFQDPNWVQAAELFAEIIVPCGTVYFVHEGLLTLAKDIVQQAKTHNCKVSYFYGRGYNAVAGNPRGGFTRKEEVDYSATIREIEQWIKGYIEF